MYEIHATYPPLRFRGCCAGHPDQKPKAIKHNGRLWVSVGGVYTGDPDRRRLHSMMQLTPMDEWRGPGPFADIDEKAQDEETRARIIADPAEEHDEEDYAIVCGTIIQDARLIPGSDHYDACALGRCDPLGFEHGTVVEVQQLGPMVLTGPELWFEESQHEPTQQQLFA